MVCAGVTAPLSNLKDSVASHAPLYSFLRPQILDATFLDTSRTLIAFKAAGKTHPSPRPIPLLVAYFWHRELQIREMAGIEIVISAQRTDRGPSARLAKGNGTEERTLE